MAIFSESEGNNKTSAQYGVIVDQTSNNNVVTWNETTGGDIGILMLWSSSFNTVTDNTMSNHGRWGMFIRGNANYNYVYNNNFINNAYSPQITVIEGSFGNVFNLDSPTGGNYWSDYDGSAEGCNDVSPVDGFCDQSYSFDGGPDYLPLTSPTQGAPLEVVIDIKPGNFPNSINLGSGGTVPVAIFSAIDFDATTVDPLTVTLAGAEVALKGKGTPMASAEDVDGDGLLDLVVHVSTEALELSETDTEAVLEGKTIDGMAIEGAVRSIVP